MKSSCPKFKLGKADVLLTKWRKQVEKLAGGLPSLFIEGICFLIVKRVNNAGSRMISRSGQKLPKH